MVDDRSHAIIARTQVRGGNSSITVDESEVALDSADLADASYCGIMLTKATLTTAATSRIGSAAYGLQHDGASVFPDQGLAFDDVTHGSHLKQTLTVTGESTEYLYTWRDADAREWNQVDTYDSDGTLTGTRVVEPAKTAEQRAAELQPLLDELDALVGLQSVKKQVRLVIDTVRFNQLRQSQGLPPVPATTNLVFLGNPGTGKTTVARLYGRILAALGAIRTGQVVEASRTDLVGRYLGETAQKTTQKIEEALGGVLFIDEAYALSRVMGAHSDFGIEAIDTLVLALENRRDDLVVIVAGYTFEMDGFLQTNPGLASRFGARILFEDYSLDDMVEILRRDVSKSEFTISDEALAILREQMASQHERLASGNAREVRKLVEAMQRAQASRIMRASLDGTPTREQLRELLPSDADEWMQGD
jgi:AAA+ superfamily predicted ATPase